MSELNQTSQRINNLTNELQQLKEYRQRICPHINITKVEGYTEYQGYDRTHIPGYIKCNDCGLYASQNDYKTYNMLNNR
jgi:hypothetical protein